MGSILGVLMLIGFGLDTSVVHASDFSKDELKTLAVGIATEHNLDVDKFLKTIDCESGWDSKAVGPTGDYGIVQINKKAHPEISLDQMYQPLFSMEWMAKQWELKHQRWWVCYRSL